MFAKCDDKYHNSLTCLNKEIENIRSMLNVLSVYREEKNDAVFPFNADFSFSNDYHRIFCHFSNIDRIKKRYRIEKQMNFHR